MRKSADVRLQSFILFVEVTNPTKIKLAIIDLNNVVGDHSLNEVVQKWRLKLAEVLRINDM